MDAIPFDTATLAYADSETMVYVAGVGGGPRVQVQREGVVVADFFAFENTFRGGCRAAFADGQLYVGPGAGGGLVEARYDLTQPVLLGVPVEVSREFRGDLSMREGWQPVAPPHPRDPDVIPLTNHPRYPVSPDHFAAVERELTYVPRSVQEQVRDAGGTIVVHNTNLAVLSGSEFNAPLGDGLRTVGVVRSFVADGRIAYVYPADGAIAHEVGHLAWHLLLTDDQRTTWLEGGTIEDFAQAFSDWCYLGHDARGFFHRLGW